MDIDVTSDGTKEETVAMLEAFQNIEAALSKDDRMKPWMVMAVLANITAYFIYRTSTPAQSDAVDYFLETLKRAVMENSHAEIKEKSGIRRPH